MLRKLLLKSGMTFQMRYAQPLRMQVGLRTVRRGLVSARLEATHLTHSQTAAAELYKQADEETKKLLKMAGVSEPEGPPPTALQAVHQANKAYQKHTADLRQLVLRRVTLQSKCDKAKLAYEAMCRELRPCLMTSLQRKRRLPRPISSSRRKPRSQLHPLSFVCLKFSRKQGLSSLMIKSIY